MANGVVPWIYGMRSRQANRWWPRVAYIVSRSNHNFNYEVIRVNKILSCPKCDFETNESLAKCPNCGRRLQSAKKVRILGWLLVLLGTGLVVFMAGLGIVLAGLIAESGQPGRTARFTGGPQDVLFIFAIFGLVIAFGLASMAGGAWQIWYGKPNRKVMVLMFVVAGLLFAIGSAIRNFN